MNNIFLSLVDKSGFFQTQTAEGNKLYHQLGRVRNNRIIIKDKVFVGWNRRLIEAGNYFYAFSHIPEHKLTLPSNTFTVTCIRNPVNRVLSHYKEILFYAENNIRHPVMKVAGDWLGNSFGDYLSSAPRKELLGQLYMFSEQFNVEESLDKIVGCSHFFFTEDFSVGIKELSLKLGIKLEPIHIRKSRIEYNFALGNLDRLNFILEPELLLYNKLRQAKQQ